MSLLLSGLCAMGEGGLQLADEPVLQADLFDQFELLLAPAPVFLFVEGVTAQQVIGGEVVGQGDRQLLQDGDFAAGDLQVELIDPLHFFRGVFGVFLSEFGETLGGENLALDFVGEGLGGEAGGIALEGLDGILFVYDDILFMVCLVIYIASDISKKLQKKIFALPAFWHGFG